ncbi:hypothetical protein [Brevibacillus sp. 1238]|uniref:hypothetical protein n=1 Tax=Brevibacillus sp. 1238 TaxID=2940565 RepID=UPI0024757507|nr:hypothetical protein [Brevibacillus sp. 1238]MDH6351952.1 hypothetical protein [Brevibacillus sp. 1238]
MRYWLRDKLLGLGLLVIAVVIAVGIIFPLVRSALVSAFGDQVTTVYVAIVDDVKNAQAKVRWIDDVPQLPMQNDKYVAQKAWVNIEKFPIARVGDTVDLAVTAPGTLKKLGNPHQYTKLEVVDLNLNWFSEAWRYITK